MKKKSVKEEMPALKSGENRGAPGVQMGPYAHIGEAAVVPHWSTGIRFRTAKDRQNAINSVDMFIADRMCKFIGDREVGEKEQFGRLFSEIEKLKRALWQESQRHISDNIDWASGRQANYGAGAAVLGTVANSRG